jgi:hypothetical protein
LVQLVLLAAQLAQLAPPAQQGPKVFKEPLAQLAPPAQQGLKAFKESLAQLAPPAQRGLKESKELLDLPEFKELLVPRDRRGRKEFRESRE